MSERAAEAGTIASSPDASVATIKRAAGWEAYQRHDGEVPEGFRFYFRRYGKHGGRWRGVDPYGSWVESTDEMVALDELWWMVAAYEIDQEAKADA